jgi:DNA-binding protein HU-beta
MTQIPTSKSDIIDAMAAAADISKSDAAKALNCFIDSIQKALKHGLSVPLMGFGTFSIKPRAARTGRNPKTGAPIAIKASNQPVFKAGKGLKDIVNSAALEEA